MSLRGDKFLDVPARPGQHVVANVKYRLCAKHCGYGSKHDRD